MPNVLLAGTHGNIGCVRMENGEMKNDGGIAAVDIESVKGIITRLIIGRIVPSIAATGIYGNVGRIKVEKGKMEDDSGVTAVDIEGVECVITRLIIGCAMPSKIETGENRYRVYVDGHERNGKDFNAVRVVHWIGEIYRVCPHESMAVPV